jgi:hypothetical protein
MKVASPKTTPSAHKEEKLFLLMAEGEKCPLCEYPILILEVEKRIYHKGRGVASCAKCGHQAWYRFFANGQPIGRVITQADVDFLLFDPDF